MTFEAGLFQPDTLLSAQYFATFNRNFHLEPEKKLLLAVLEDAIDSFQRYFLARDGRGEKLFREAENWLLEENRNWLLSFDNICELLGFDPKYIRKQLLRWKYKKLAQSMVRRRVGKPF